jgi:hypothetical protein
VVDVTVGLEIAVRDDLLVDLGDQHGSTVTSALLEQRR